MDLNFKTVNGTEL